MYKLHVDTGNSIHTETDSLLRKCPEKQTPPENGQHPNPILTWSPTFLLLLCSVSVTTVQLFCTSGVHMQGREDAQEAPRLKKGLSLESLTSTLCSLLVTE
jgi:hypothetical protein